MKRSVLLIMLFSVQINWAQSTFPTDGGNVGIGTLTPTVKLDVVGTIKSYEPLPLGVNPNSFQLINDRSGNVGENTIMNRLWTYRDGPSNNWYNSRLHDGISVDNYFKTPHLDTKTWWERDPLDNIQSWGNASETYVTISSGNVGIGTTSPSSKLDVVGEVRSYGVGFGQIDAVTSSKNYANFSSNNHGSVILSSNLYFSTNDILKIANTHGTMAGGAILLPGNSQPNQGKIQFLTTPPSSVTQDQLFGGTISMEITGNGNVGIGIINPTNKLDVNGTIHSKEVKVDMTGWSDFAFKKEYNLPTLEEVEKHIVEKGHLKNIPSEKEVLKDGISLGEMNAKLLQKIEELTLYLIEQEKKNNKQSEEIDFLKKENKIFQSILERITKLENQSK